MKIRKMNEKHLESIIEIEEKTYNQPWTYKQFRNSIGNSRSKCYVVIDDDILCGYIMLFRQDDNWYIENLTVHEEHRRKKIGTKLVQFAKKVTHPEPILTLVQDGFLPMHLLLKSVGFRATHIIKDLDNDEYYSFTTD